MLLVCKFVALVCLVVLLFGYLFPDRLFAGCVWFVFIRASMFYFVIYLRCFVGLFAIMALIVLCLLVSFCVCGNIIRLLLFSFALFMFTLRVCGLLRVLWMLFGVFLFCLLVYWFLLHCWFSCFGV